MSYVSIQEVVAGQQKTYRLPLTAPDLSRGEGRPKSFVRVEILESKLKKLFK